MNQEELNIGLTCSGRHADGQSGIIIGYWKSKHEVRYLVGFEGSHKILHTLTKKWLERWRTDTDDENNRSVDKVDLMILSEKELEPYMKNKYFAWVDAKNVTIDSRIKTLDEILNDIEDETN